jgi:hypothetical protein
MGLPSPKAHHEPHHRAYPVLRLQGGESAQCQGWVTPKIPSRFEPRTPGHHVGPLKDQPLQNYQQSM